MKGAVGSVVVQIQSIAILSDSEYLTVQIEGCSFPSETAQIAIRKKLPVSLIPESLFFSSTDLENIQAIGLIRIRQLIVQLPVDVSDMKVLDHSSVDLDPSLQSLTFSIVERNGKAFVEAKGPSDLIAATRVSGKVRLKVNDKVVSETTLVIKKRTDIELLPDYVTLKFDPVNKEFRGELIAKLLIGSVRIEDVRIEAEHIDDIPIELSVGKMSSSTGRVYLSVKGAVSPKDQDQILFRISSPLKTEEQVLRIKVVR